MSTVQRIADHLSEYVARYTVLVIVVLTPLAGALGEVAAKLGGVDTQAGRAVLGAASALAAIIAGATFLNNLGRWQIAERQRAAMLRERGVEVTEQLAVGRYNVDVALDESPVAVEVSGGGGNARRQARRVPRIAALVRAEIEAANAGK